MRAWTPGFSSALSTYSSSPSGSASHSRWYRSRTREALRAKCGSRGKIHDRCCQGLMASSASQRRTVDAEGAGAIPLAAAWRGSSGQVQRATGVPLAAGISHARALTSATARAGNARGLPDAAHRPPRPGRAGSTGGATCGRYPRRCPAGQRSPAGRPSAASSTIRARCTSRNGAVARREADSSSARRHHQADHGRAGRHGDSPSLTAAGQRRHMAALHDETARVGHDGHMAKPPESTKTSLRQRLTAHARQRWPQLADLTVRYHGAFAYVDGQLPDGTTLPLCRLRYGGSAQHLGLRHLPGQPRRLRRQPSCPAATPPAPRKKPSTAPAASTSTTLPPGSARHPRRINGRDH